MGATSVATGSIQRLRCWLGRHGNERLQLTLVEPAFEMEFLVAQELAQETERGNALRAQALLDETFFHDHLHLAQLVKPAVLNKPSVADLGSI